MVLLDAGPDHTGFDPGRSVRLLGLYTPGRLGPGAGEPRGLAMLLHGWEGDSHSAYNLSMGSALVRAGYDVLRLNMRDHGPTHHLNKGLFYATLIQEVHAAAKQVGLLAGRRPFFLIGASLGANFVVRMALRNVRNPIPQPAPGHRRQSGAQPQAYLHASGPARLPAALFPQLLAQVTAEKAAPLSRPVRLRSPGIDSNDLADERLVDQAVRSVRQCRRILERL